MSDENEQAPQGPVNVYEIAAIVMDQMGAIAWSKLGLQPDLATGKIEPDLAQAKVAIDIVANIATTIDSTLDENDRRQVQNLVRDLRMNFIEKSQAAGK